MKFISKSAFIAFVGFAIPLLSLNASAAAPGPAKGSAAPDQGKRVYDQHCAACHGANGDGNGPAAVWLYPKPRDFRSGLFKIQSTPAGSVPTDDDLLGTITRGMPGSSMPSFTYLSEQDRRAAVEQVKKLAAYIDENGKTVNVFEEAKRNGQAPASISVPPEPPLTLQSMTEGKELFARLQCASCHGETGAGDGPSAPTLKDKWGFPLRPRDFNTGAFRGGHTGRDLFLRIAVGMAGTPMPPFPDDMITPEQRWSLVHYILSLRRKDVEVNDMLAAELEVPARKFQGPLPTDPSDPAWDRLEVTRVPLNPLWPAPYLIPALAVRAVHDGRNLALLLQWRDPILNGAPVRIQDFQDAVAVQFSLNGTTPFLGMGDAQNPVNIWQWKAGWQEAMTRVRPDVNTVYASMHVDLYPENSPLFRTAEAAGNLLAFPSVKTSVEDANAQGFGTFQAQKPEGQNVKGNGLWFDGHWSVVLLRSLSSEEKNDIQFTPGNPIPIAFAVWDGEQRERNGWKVISNWFQFVLEP